MTIEDKLSLVKELRINTLKEILNKFGHPTGRFEEMKLSILDVKIILYDESRKIAKREIINW